ncbi:MAG: DUF2937 family protein [Bosea sp. (in: a-proteobacteria)]
MIGRTIAAAIGAFAAFAASQVPEFAQQYRQRLGGALDELTTIVQRFDADAARQGFSRDQGLTRLKEASDPFQRQRASAEEANIRRQERLKLQKEVLAQSGPVVRVTALLTEGDRELMDRTLTEFEPAMPVTAEGTMLAAGGFASGYLLTRLTGGLLAAPFRRRRRVAAPAPPQKAA